MADNGIAQQQPTRMAKLSPLMAKKQCGMKINENINIESGVSA